MLPLSVSTFPPYFSNRKLCITIVLQNRPFLLILIPNISMASFILFHGRGGRGASEAMLRSHSRVRSV